MSIVAGDLDPRDPNAGAPGICCNYRVDLLYLLEGPQKLAGVLCVSETLTDAAPAVMWSNGLGFKAGVEGQTKLTADFFFDRSAEGEA